MKLPDFEDFKRRSTDAVWREAAKTICESHEISFDDLRRAEQGESVIFLIDEKFVVKIYTPRINGLARETAALENARTSLQIPEIVAAGKIENYDYMVQTLLPGELMTRERWLRLAEKDQIEILSQLARGLYELHRSDCSHIDFDWDGFIARQIKTCYERQKACGVNQEALAEIPVYLEENLRLLPISGAKVFLHGDVHFGNLRVGQTKGKWRISGLFDFADSLSGFHEYDFLAVCVLMIQGQGGLQREFFRAYGYAESEINEDLRRRQMLLTMFYECSDLRRYALRLRPEAVDYSLFELERAIWNFC
jgi:aminoglycoside phosphotransferase (APT) family kinase protein